MEKVMMAALVALVGCEQGNTPGAESEVADQGPGFSGSQVDTGLGSAAWSTQPIPPGEYDMVIDSVTQACDDYVVEGGEYVEVAGWDSVDEKVRLFDLAPMIFSGSDFTATAELHGMVGEACEVTDTYTVDGAKVPGTLTFTATVSEARTSSGTCTADDLAQLCDNEYDASFSYLNPLQVGLADPTLQPGEYTMTVQQVVEACDDYATMGTEMERPLILDPDTGELSLMGVAPLVFSGDTFTATGGGTRVVEAACEVTDELNFTGYLNGTTTSFDASVEELRTASGTCTTEDLAQVCDNRYEASFVYNPVNGQPL